MPTIPKIIIPGGSGLLGEILSHHFASRGFQIVILSRNPPKSPHKNPLIQTHPWNPYAPGPWQQHLDNAAALINLTGRSVDCRYTRKNRDAIYNSRIFSTQTLANALAQTPNPPPVWLNASTATIYKHSFTPMDESTGLIAATPEAHDAFSLEVATAWEAALQNAHTPNTRKIALRLAMVLAPGNNSVFPILRRLVRCGLGGTIGPGTQFLSWIHHTDFCRAVEFLIHSNLAGPINLAAPNPLPNRLFMQIFRQTFHRPCGLPAPTPLLKAACLLLRTEPELLLKSRCVIPARLQSAGFTFQFPTLPQALQNLASTA